MRTHQLGGCARKLISQPNAQTNSCTNFYKQNVKQPASALKVAAAERRLVQLCTRAHNWAQIRKNTELSYKVSS